MGGMHGTVRRAQRPAVTDRLGPARLPVELRPGLTRLDWLLRHWLAVALAGVVTGVAVGGGGGRLFMRLSALAAPSEAVGRVTEAGNVVGEITLGGTVGFVVFVGIMSGIVGTMLYVAVEPWLAWGRRWGGLVFGVFLAAVAVPASDAMSPHNPDFVILQRPVFNVTIILSLFLLYGVVMSVLVDVADRLLAPAVQRASRLRVAMLGMIVAVLGGFGVFSTAFFYLSEDASGSEPVLVGAVALAVAGGMSLLWWVRWVWSDERSNGWVAATAVAALATAFVVYALRTIGSVVSIV